MKTICIYGLLCIMFLFLFGCRENSVYQSEPNRPFMPREYYRKHIKVEEIGFYSSESLAEIMKKELKNQPFVKHVLVIKQGEEYRIAVKLKAYEKKSAEADFKFYEKKWSDQWAVPIKISFSREEYRKIEREINAKKRA